MWPRTTTQTLTHHRAGIAAAITGNSYAGPTTSFVRWPVFLGALGALLLTAFIQPARASSDQKPRRGGTIAVRAIFTPSCLDPTKANNYVLPEVFDGLVSFDDHNRARPDLALSWKASHGGGSITFILRRGVRFSNGDRFDARTVKSEFDQLAQSAQPGNTARFRKVEVLNTYTLRIVLKAPFRPLLTSLGLPPIVDPKVEAALGDRTCQAPVGTGAFKIESVAPGFSAITLVRNPYHTWAPSWQHNKGRAYLDRVIVKPIVDDATAVSELLSGDLDISRVPGTQLDRVRNNRTIVLHRSLEPGELYLGFNMSRPPFKRPAVRGALAEAIDRKALIKVALGGLGKPAYSPIPAASPFYDKAARGYAASYSPSRARRVLAANHVMGPYTLVTYTIPAFATTAEFVQAQLAQVGVSVKLAIKPVQDAQRDMKSGAFDMQVNIWNSDDLYPFLNSHGDTNTTFYRDATLDRLLTRTRETLNSKEAATAFKELQHYVAKKTIVVPLFSREIVVAGASRLEDWHGPTLSTTPYPVLQDLQVTR